MTQNTRLNPPTDPLNPLPNQNHEAKKDVGWFDYAGCAVCSSCAECCADRRIGFNMCASCEMCEWCRWCAK